MSRYIDAEPRYIDADSLKQKWLFRGKDGKPYRDEIDAQPTADVIEVVRCKDCKFYQDNNGGYPNPECKWIDGETPNADDFCSFAERRTE